MPSNRKSRPPRAKASRSWERATGCADTLKKVSELQTLAAHSGPRERPSYSMDCGRPVHTTLGPPAFGDAAKLAAAWRELRHEAELAQAATDRLRVEVAKTPESFGLGVPDNLAHALAVCAETEVRVNAARARLNHVKEAIRQRRITRAAAHSSEIAERAMRQLLREDDERVVPFGARPKPGSRLLPLTDEPPRRDDVARDLVDRILAQ